MRFILRGVSLVGIDSQHFPIQLRETVWKKLASDWKLEDIHSVISEVSLSEVNARIDDMLAGRHKGRTLISLSV